MIEEFRNRITLKRSTINRLKQRCRELTLRDTMIICERCSQDMAPLKTFNYESQEFHYATCVFGSFQRVEVKDALATKID